MYTAAVVVVLKLLFDNTITLVCFKYIYVSNKWVNNSDKYIVVVFHMYVYDTFIYLKILDEIKKLVDLPSLENNIVFNQSKINS